MRLTKILYAAIVSLVGAIQIKAATSSSNSNNLCQNVWKYPPNCLGNCTYQLVWRFKPLDDSIEFIVSSKHAQRWTGVGFASDKSLINSDAIFAWIEDNSRYVMMDAYLPTYSTPISDKTQSISNISATVSNGLISFRFTRKRNTGDPLEDLIFGDDKCPYLVYPVEGGSVDIKNRVVITSEHEPHVSEAPVCIRACNYKPPGSTSTTTAATSTPTTATTSTTTTTRAPTTTPTTRRPTTTTSVATTTTTTTTTTTSTTTTTRRPTTTTAKPPTTTTTTTTTTTQRPPTTTTAAPPTTTTPAPATVSTSTAAASVAPTATVSSSSEPITTPIKPSVGDLSAANQSQQQQSQSDQQWCVGRWSHPPNCRFQASPATADTLAYLKQPIDESMNIKPLPLELSDCSYMAQWQYLEQSDSVEFIIQTKTRNRWTGIGFSNSTRMANSDAIIGLIEELSGRHFIMDTWLRDHVMPEIDQHQNTESTWGKRENGTTTVRFRRKRVTGDQFDFQFTDDSCAYFFFPTQGGSFNAISKRMHKHESVPSVSKQRICIKSCTRPTTTSSSNDVKLKLAASTSSQSVGGDEVEATQATVAATSQAAESSSSSVVVGSHSSVGGAQSNSNSSPAPTGSQPATTIVDQAPPTATGGGQQQDEKNNSNNINLSPSNDLGADIDSSSSTSSASSGQTSSSIQQNNASSSGHKLNSSADSNPFSKLTFLTEPSLRWLAGIGCVATLLAMIVFQACFTVYKNKQAYKQNLYRQSALKQNAASFLQGAYTADGSSAVSSSAAGGGADLHHHSSHPSSNSMGLNGSVSDHPPQRHSHPHHQHPHHSHSHPHHSHGQHPHLAINAAGTDVGVAGGHHATRAHAHALGLRRAESSVVPEEEQLDEVEEDEMEEMEELEEVEEDLEEEEYEDEEEPEEELEDFEYESSLYYHHPQLQLQQQHHHHPSRMHQAMPMGAPTAGSNHSGHHRHAHQQQQLRMHPSHHQQQYPHALPIRNIQYQAQAQAQAHQQHHHHHNQPSHHRQQSNYQQQQQQPLSHHRHHQSSRNPFHIQQQPHQMGGHLQSRPDSYFLPSQRRY